MAKRWNDGEKPRSLELPDVFSSIGECSNCGKDLLLEADDLANIEASTVARCWNCGHTQACNLHMAEGLVNKHFDGVSTWRSTRTFANLPDGFLATGKALFTTSEEIEKLRKQFGEEGLDGEASKLLESISDREEAIAQYLAATDADAAYHMASAKHTCGAKDGYTPMVCKENVFWIITSPGPLIGEFFNLYGTVLLAWRCLEKKLAAGDGNITNENEIRQSFIECLQEANHFGYKFNLWQEREIVISVDGEDMAHFPDVQLRNLVVIEIKSFLKDQTYSAAQSKKLVKDDLDKLKKYKGLFSVGFMLVLSDKYTVAQLRPDELPKYNYPVRVLIRSTVE